MQVGRVGCESQCLCPSGRREREGDEEQARLNELGSPKELPRVARISAMGGVGKGAAEKAAWSGAVRTDTVATSTPMRNEAPLVFAKAVAIDRNHDVAAQAGRSL